MRHVRARVALLFDVDNLAVRSNLAISTGNAAAGQRRESKEANETHHGQTLDIAPKATSVPMKRGKICSPHETPAMRSPTFLA